MECCLNFWHERPTFRNFDLKWMREIQRTGEWTGELFLEESFGFLVIDKEKKLSFFHRRNLKPLIVDIDLPADSVFEVGQFFIQDKMFLIFYDILIHRGEKLLADRLTRFDLLESLIEIKDNVILPLQIDFWFHEYALLLENKGTLAKKFALRYGIPFKDFLPIVKGMLVKKKKSFLSYPEKFRFTNEAFCLTLETDKKNQYSQNSK